MGAHVGGRLPVFRGYSSQYGSGLGNILGGIMRRAIPIVAPMMKRLGRNLVKAGANKLIGVIDDVPFPGGRRRRRTAPPSRGRAPQHKRRPATRRAPVGRSKRRKRDILS